MDLTDAQWALLEPLLREKRRSDGRGRPWRDSRQVLNGVLWVLRTGAPWQDLPDRYSPYQTCHRRFQRWVHHGILTRILEVLAEDLRARGGLDVSEAFTDASFSSAKKGAPLSVPLGVAKGPKSWQWPTAMVFLSPLALPVLLRMKRSSSKKRSSRASSRKSPNA